MLIFFLFPCCSLPLEAPIAVLGDASSSMDVAIRTSTIIASILTAITNAKLSFFHTENIVPDKLPETVEQVRASVSAERMFARSLWILH